MQLSNILLLSSALAGASAGHVHGRHHLEQRSGGFVKAVKSAAVVESAPTPTPSSTKTGTISSIVDDVTDAIESTISDVADAVYKAFCDGSVTRRATTAEIAYAGNTGTEGNYGCNIMQVSEALVHKYDYTMQITNVASEAYEVICWNKIGRTGGINGFFKGMGEAVTLNLAAGESAVVAFESNTQGACGFGKGSVPTSTEGCYQGTWAEFDFENSSNKGWSGADCSALTSEDTAGVVEGCRLCDADDSTCSTIYPDGSGDNAYTKGTNDLDGVGINTAPGNITYFLQVGYSK